MFCVVKLGGCNGSGKTTVATAMLDIIGAKPKFARQAPKKNPNYYTGTYEDCEVLVLGSYETVCGGMDTISDKLHRLDLIDWACQGDKRIVFFEGLITGKTYGAIGELSESHVEGLHGRWIYAFMDTPFERCVERVLARRLEKGNTNDFDPERTMRPTFDSCLSLRRKIQQRQQAVRGPQPMAHPVLVLDHRKKATVLAREVLRTAYSGFDWKRAVK